MRGIAFVVCLSVCACLSHASVVSKRQFTTMGGKGHDGERGARVYNGGLRPGAVQGQSPWSGGQGAKPPEAEMFFALECAKEAAILVLCGSFGNSRKPLIFAYVSLNFCNLIAVSSNNNPASERTAVVQVAHRTRRPQTS